MYTSRLRLTYATYAYIHAWSCLHGYKNHKTHTYSHMSDIIWCIRTYVCACTHCQTLTETIPRLCWVAVPCASASEKIDMWSMRSWRENMRKPWLEDLNMWHLSAQTWPLKHWNRMRPHRGYNCRLRKPHPGWPATMKPSSRKAPVISLPKEVPNLSGVDPCPVDLSSGRPKGSEFIYIYIYRRTMLSSEVIVCQLSSLQNLIGS